MPQNKLQDASFRHAETVSVTSLIDELSGELCFVLAKVWETDGEYALSDFCAMIVSYENNNGKVKFAARYGEEYRHLTTHYVYRTDKEYFARATVKSKLSFAFEEVKIGFGSDVETIEMLKADDDFVGVGLYLGSADEFRDAQKLYNDSRQCYWQSDDIGEPIEFIAKDEYCSGDFMVDFPFVSAPKFNHFEDLQVPSALKGTPAAPNALLAESKNEFCIYVMAIMKNEQGRYYPEFADMINFTFEPETFIITHAQYSSPIILDNILWAE